MNLFTVREDEIYTLLPIIVKIKYSIRFSELQCQITLSCRWKMVKHTLRSLGCKHGKYALPFLSLCMKRLNLKIYHVYDSCRNDKITTFSFPHNSSKDERALNLLLNLILKYFSKFDLMKLVPNLKILLKVLFAPFKLLVFVNIE